MKRPVSVLLPVAVVFCLSVLLQTGTKLVAAEISLRKTDHGYKVNLDGKLFAEYRTDWNGTPIIWPVIGPNEKPMTRPFPMSDANPNDVKDHPHHRSLWFTHDGVNGNNFWTTGIIAHQEFSKTECDGKTATLVTENHWLDGKTKETVCSDVRTVTFGTINSDNNELRFIDFDVTLTAEQETVTIADTKEGTFGIRVPSLVAVDAKKKDAKLGGTIVNAQGDKDDNAWGKRSTWVDYSGPVDGETAGIAVMNHPTSFRFPTWWHVRTYGLFAANPFGIKDFEPSLKQDGTVTLKKGESLTFRYRVILHRGNATAVDLPKLFEDYAGKEYDK